ncbi:TonB-dependent receptor [Glycocaulis profundi]|nr:TonB-dependent receptor [Glycocaulis profundi]
MIARVTSRMFQGASLTALATSLAVPAAFAGQEPAQTQPEPTEVITILGSYSGSLASALDRKRNADSIIDAINAEDIGNFPSQNIAESLQRITGVSIERDRGEGLFVSVRGLGANFQVTTLNGRSIAVNENVRDSGQDGRQFRFDTIPSELVAGVDVIKSPTADLEEGAIGGVVNIRTFRPLDLEAGTIAASVTASYPELADTVDPRASALGSWRNEARTIGFLGAVAYAQRTMRQDRITGVGWTFVEEGLNTDGQPGPDTGPIIAPTAVRPTLELEDRERISLNGVLQYAPTAEFDITLEGLFTRLDGRYDELTYSADVDRASIVPGSAVIENGVLVAATTSGSTQIGREVSDLRHDNVFVALKAEYRPGDWTLSGDVYATRAYSDTNSPITRTRLLGPVGQVRLEMPRASGVLPAVTFLDADLTEPGLLPFRRVEWRENDSEDTELAAALDVSRILDAGPLNRIAAGVKHRDRDREYNRQDINFTSLAGQFFTADFFNPMPVSGFLGAASGDLPRAWLQPRPDPFFAASDTSALGQPPQRGDLRNSYQVAEAISSAYLMGDFETSVGAIPVRGNAGVRVAHTVQTSSGHADTGSQAVPVRFETSYTDVLPSANLVFDLSDTVMARVSAARVITRPSLSALAPRITLNSSGSIFTAVGGNPELERFQAWQYDGTVEWYFAPASALIAGVFYKDIGTFVYNQVTDLVIDGQTYALTAPTNGGEATIYGFELAYQQLLDFLPAPFDGLGFQANYTHTETEAVYSETITDEMENVARDSFNISAFYEQDRFAARLSYSWRGDVLRSVGTNNFLSANDKAFGSLDGSLVFNMNDNLSVAFEGINLTDEAQIQFVADDRFGGYTHYGRTLSVSLRSRF